MATTVRSLLAVALVALMAAPASAGGVAVTAVECGLFRDYVAPDAGTDTPGTITFGLTGTPETIAPAAVLVPPTNTSLPSLQGGAPTALSVTRDAGVITALAFAASCTLSGTPTLVEDLFGPDADGYVISDRLFVPVGQVQANAGLSALIGTAAEAGTTFSVTFAIDLDFGVPSGFTATTNLSGSVVMLPNGDVEVGAAMLPSAVVDDAARAELQAAADLGVPAAVIVSGIGSVDASSEGDVAVTITLTVSFAAPPPSPIPSPTQAPLPDTALGASDG
jgi:hypothetical protein